MSRSIRHQPIVGYTSAQSEQWDKRFFNRAYRRRCRVLTNTLDTVDMTYCVDKYEGKYYGEWDIEWYPERLYPHPYEIHGGHIYGGGGMKDGKQYLKPWGYHNQQDDCWVWILTPDKIRVYLRK